MIGSKVTLGMNLKWEGLLPTGLPVEVYIWAKIIYFLKGTNIL